MDVHGCAWMCMNVHGMEHGMACACHGAQHARVHGAREPPLSAATAPSHLRRAAAAPLPSARVRSPRSTPTSGWRYTPPRARRRRGSPRCAARVPSWRRSPTARYTSCRGCRPRRRRTWGGNQRAVAGARAAMLGARAEDGASGGRVRVRVRGSHPAEISSRSGANAARIGSTWRETRWRGGVRASNAAMGRGAERWH